jgi:hypothetical protein
MYDEGPLLPVYQQRKVFEFDPIGKVMFGNDDLKVSRGNIEPNCLVPQKNPDLESIIIDVSEVKINGINKGVDEELFIQKTIVIEDNKNMDEKNMKENSTNSETEGEKKKINKRTVIGVKNYTFLITVSFDEIQFPSKNHEKRELDKMSTGSCHRFRTIQEIPDIQIDKCFDENQDDPTNYIKMRQALNENSKYSSTENLYTDHPQIR